MYSNAHEPSTCNNVPYFSLPNVCIISYCLPLHKLIPCFEIGSMFIFNQKRFLGQTFASLQWNLRHYGLSVCEVQM